jgi:hypothetical protein
MAKNSYYFPHDYHARHDPKLERLRMEIGAVGDGVYWDIVEMLYEEGGYLPLKNIPLIAKILNTPEELVNKVVKSAELFVINGDKFTSESLLKRLKHIQAKIRKARTSGRLGGLAKAKRTSSERLVKKVKEIRESKESKVNEIKDNISYSGFEQATLIAWNSFCDKNPSFSKVKEISDKRRASLKKRFERESFRAFDKILRAIQEQPFLKGENERKWKVNFDWLIENDNNYLKVLELRYKDKINSDMKAADPDCQICAGSGWDETEGSKKLCHCRIVR